MKKIVSRIPEKLRVTGIIAAAAIAVLFAVIHFIPAAGVKEGSHIQLERGQAMVLHLEEEGSRVNAAAVRSDRPTVASIGKDMVLHANNPGECTLKFFPAIGKTVTCRISVSCKKGLLKNDTLGKYGAGSCRNLMIVAHPDDETLWGGAHLKNGNYFIVCLTNGNHPIRSREYRSVLRESGSKGIILNYPDIYKHVKNNWSLVHEGMNRDLQKILQYKNWDRIVTYNPDGVTGHIHHRMTYAATIQLCRKDHLTDHVYYFGTYYKKGTVPDGLRSLNAKDLDFKESLVNIYQHEMHSINHYWRQMIPHENWIRYRDWRKTV